MEKFDIENFEINKNYCIEASAGTGKTYNIVEIVSKLVNKYNIDLNQILVVTYTEKAAGELKSRIRSKLNGIDVDSAPIYTIHSFCQNTIKEFALSANLPLNSKLVNESFIDKFADEYFRENSIVDDIVKELSNNKEFKIDQFKKCFIEGVKKYYKDINYESNKNIVSLSKNIGKIVEEAKTVSDFYEIDPNIEKYYKILKNSSFERSNNMAIELENVSKKLIFDGRKFRLSHFDGKTSNEETEAFNFFNDLKKKLEILFKNKYEKYVLDYIDDFYYEFQKAKEKNRYIDFNDLLRNVREAIYTQPQLIEKLQKKYKYAIIDEFQDTNQIQFDIFSEVFLKDENHNIIVVGDPKQSIYSFQGADVFVYSKAVDLIVSRGGIKCSLNKNFRSTKDVVSACNELFDEYDFKNTTFEHSDYLDITKDRGEDLKDKKEYKALYNGKEFEPIWIGAIKNIEEKDDSIENIELEEVKSETDEIVEEIKNEYTDVDNHIDVVNEYQFAKIATQTIIDCCTKIDGKTRLQIKDKDANIFRNVSFKDFCVLARTSTEMEAIRYALSNCGIPFLRYKDNTLFKGIECAHWISLLEAIDLPDFTGYNRNKFRKALFTKFFGLGLDELSSIDFDKDDNKQMELIIRWKELVLNRKWEDLIDDIIISSGITERMNGFKDNQSLNIFKQLGNYCIDYLSNDHSLEELIDHLKCISKFTDSDDDEKGDIVEKGTDFDCVKIMTMHASKGLQFPVVISVAGFKDKNKNASKAFIEHNNDNEAILVFNRSKQVNNEEIEEIKRLFYVGYTRAQYLLIIPNYKKLDGYSFIYDTLQKFMQKSYKYKIICDNKKDETQLREECKAILNTINASPSNKKEQEYEMKNLNSHLKKQSTYKHTYSELAHKGLDKDTKYSEGEITNKEGESINGLKEFDTNSIQIDCSYESKVKPITLSDKFPKGSNMGNALHEIFEKISYIKNDYWDLTIDSIIKKYNLSEDIKDNIRAILDNVLNSKLPIINGSKEMNDSIKLSSIEDKNLKKEIEFNFNLRNDFIKNYCNGFVDLIFRNGSYYSIVDWKSDKLEEDAYSDKEKLKDHVDDRYSIQRSIYAYSLIKWLKTIYQENSEEETFDKHFGGSYYVFLRGCNSETGNGIYAQTWKSWSELEKSFNKIINEKAFSRGE